MGSFHLTTFIAAPIDRVFDLSRSLAVYKNVFNQGKEVFSSTAGSSLLTKGDNFSLVAKHAGKNRTAVISIVNLIRPVAFIEEQTKGDMVQFKHEHHFKQIENGTIMIDVVDYSGPRDIIGRYLSKVYLKNYLEEMVHRKNEVVRSYAETEKWRAVLS